MISAAVPWKSRMTLMRANAARAERLSRPLRTPASDAFTEIRGLSVEFVMAKRTSDLVARRYLARENDVPKVCRRHRTKRSSLHRLSPLSLAGQPKFLALAPGPVCRRQAPLRPICQPQKTSQVRDWREA